MDTKEFQRQRKQILEECYREDPETAGWVKTKRILWRVTAGYFILHMVIEFLARNSLLLYLLALANFVLLLISAENMLGTLPYLSDRPLMGAMMLMEVLLPFLLLALAIYLTAIPKHRELSERAWEICKKSMEGFHDAMNR